MRPRWLRPAAASPSPPTPTWCSRWISPAATSAVWPSPAPSTTWPRRRRGRWRWPPPSSSKRASRWPTWSASAPAWRARPREAGVPIVTGDTKVVQRGLADGLYITTTGVGEVVVDARRVGRGRARRATPCCSRGSIGDHAAAVLAARGEFHFDLALESDCAPLWSLVEARARRRRRRRALPARPHSRRSHERARRAGRVGGPGRGGRGGGRARVAAGARRSASCSATTRSCSPTRARWCSSSAAEKADVGAGGPAPPPARRPGGAHRQRSRVSTRGAWPCAPPSARAACSTCRSASCCRASAEGFSCPRCRTAFAAAAPPGALRCRCATRAAQHLAVEGQGAERHHVGALAGGGLAAGHVRVGLGEQLASVRAPGAYVEGRAQRPLHARQHLARDAHRRAEHGHVAGQRLHAGQAVALALRGHQHGVGGAHQQGHLLGGRVFVGAHMTRQGAASASTRS